MKKRKLKKSVKYSIVSLSIILFLCTFTLASSRYIGAIKASEDVVAIPILNLENDKETYTIKDMMPGSKAEYTFSVSNTKAKKNNEVLLSYTFSFTLERNLPLTFKLYDITNGEREITIKNDISTEEFLQYSVEDIKKYRLEILWEANSENRGYYNDARYAGIETTLDIVLDAKQVV